MDIPSLFVSNQTSSLKERGQHGPITAEAWLLFKESERHKHSFPLLVHHCRSPRIWWCFDIAKKCRMRKESENCTVDFILFYFINLQRVLIFKSKYNSPFFYFLFIYCWGKHRLFSLNFNDYRGRKKGTCGIWEYIKRHHHSNTSPSQIPFTKSTPDPPLLIF
jgi:hypothetical protein